MNPKYTLILGQGRIDGAFCEHEDEEKFSWLRTLKDNGVTNMEMESLGFIAMCHRANIKGRCKSEFE